MLELKSRLDAVYNDISMWRAENILLVEEVKRLVAENKALKLELHKVRCDYNRLEHQYKLLIDELMRLKE